jgi:hypothetical protein
MADTTSNIDHLLIRRKTTGPVVFTDLLNGEFVFGNTEKSLFVKAPTGDDLYQYGRIEDTSAGSSESTWSSTQIINYITDNVAHNKTILLTGGGIAPTPTNGCEEPFVDVGDDVPKIGANFDLNEYGFWNLSIPGDYKGSISKVTIIYSGPPDPMQWSIDARVLIDEDELTTGGSWSTRYNIADTPFSSSSLEIATLETPMDLFGASSNVNNFVTVRLLLSSVTGGAAYRVYQVKLEY